MSKIKVILALLILIFVSCALSVGEFPDDSPNSGSESSSDGSSSSITAGSSSSIMASSSSSTTASSSSSITASSSSSITVGSSSSIIASSSSSITASSSSSTTAGSSSSVSSSSEAPAPIYGADFLDPRDSKTYKTVIIGTQTWMESNLNYKPSSASGHKCYAEGYGYDTWLKPTEDQSKIEANCDKFGRLYDWVTARTVCPTGWHLPSRDEWNVLKNYVYDILWNNYEDEDFGWGVGTKLKATDGWKVHDVQGNNGIDAYGFNAIGGGYCYSCDQEGLNSAVGSYSGIGDRGNGDSEVGHWWSDTQYTSPAGNTEQAWRFTMKYNDNGFIEKYEIKSDHYSVRCVKN